MYRDYDKKREQYTHIANSYSHVKITACAAWYCVWRRVSIVTGKIYCQRNEDSKSYKSCSIHEKMFSIDLNWFYIFIVCVILQVKTYTQLLTAGTLLPASSFKGHCQNLRVLRHCHCVLIPNPSKAASSARRRHYRLAHSPMRAPPLNQITLTCKKNSRE